MPKTEAKTNIVTLTLSNGMDVKFNPMDATGKTLMKARQAAEGGFSTVIYLLAEIATFNGEKLPADEILNFNAFDITDLETAWSDAKKLIKI